MTPTDGPPLSTELPEQELLSLAMRIARAGAWEWNPKTNVVRWSDENYVILGLEPGSCEAAYDVWLEHVHPDDRRRTDEQVATSLASKEDLNIEYRIVRADGEVRWIRDIGKLFFDDDGEPDRMVGFQIDVTDEKRKEEQRAQLEAQLHEAQKDRVVGQLTGGVAHDFNNLLTVIIANMELILHQRWEPDRVRACAEQALDAAAHAGNLTRRLLAYARRQPLQPVDVDVREFVVRAKEFMTRTLGERFTVGIRIDEGLWLCRVDPVQLESALLNLALNARDAMPQGGVIDVVVDNQQVPRSESGSRDEPEPGDYVRLRVSDSGAGIPDDVLPHVFDPFFTTKTVGRGSGLGLSMVYGFVKQSGGRVRIESDVGTGTTVTLHLPRSQAAGPTPLDVRDATLDRSGRGEKVIVVEDEPSIRSVAGSILESGGFRPIAAADGEQALEALRSHPDAAVLFTDVVLPGSMSGVEIAAVAREELPGIHVVYTSGYARDELDDLEQAVPGGALLQKPYHADELLVAIRRALAT